jgi:hypothetical protein
MNKRSQEAHAARSSWLLTLSIASGISLTMALGAGCDPAPKDVDGDGIVEVDRNGDGVVDENDVIAEGEGEGEGNGNEGEGEGGPSADPTIPGSFGPEDPAPATRYARLTRTQWENTVRDLFRLSQDTGFSSELGQDALPASFLFDNPAEALAVDATQWSGFARAAERVAEFVTSDATRMAAIAPSGITSDAFIREFGLRAHRRPLSEEDVALYASVFTIGGSSYQGVDSFTGGVRLVIEAMLQSPFFLYRAELATEVDPVSERIHLDAYEIASRLSYALWQSMPDDELFSAASAGLLSGTSDEGVSGVEAQAIRMLDDERATRAMISFHDQLLEAEKAMGIAPSPAFFPNAPANLGEQAIEEQDLFLADLFTSGGGFADMLTSTRAFVNEDLASIYNVSGVTGEAMVPVDLDPAVRRGLFTRVAWLASNSTSVDPDPIHRGVFIARRMACIPLSAPPADIPPLPPLSENQTNRQRVEMHTQSNEPCISCHLDVINPYGFPFEMYDATGAVRTQELNGMPIDTATTPLFDEGPVPVADAVELSDLMAESQVFHDCYAEHWLNVTTGRNKQDEDGALVRRLGFGSKSGMSIKDMLVEIVTSPAFLERSIHELGGAP